MSLAIRPLRRDDLEGCLRVIASLPRFFAVGDTEGSHHVSAFAASRSGRSVGRSPVHPTRSTGRHGIPDEDDPAPTERSLAQAAKDLGTQGGLVATPQGGGDVLGFLTWKRHGDRAAEITWMAVHSALRHRGVGTTLITRIERLLAAQGFLHLSALTSASSHTYEPTRKFWKSRGYAPVLELDDLWETDTVLVLTKNLKS